MGTHCHRWSTTQTPTHGPREAGEQGGLRELGGVQLERRSSFS